MAVVLEADKVKQLTAICTDVAISYGKAFVERGLQVAIFDSQSTPPLVSPQVYGDLILPAVKRLVETLKDAGARFVEYVVGGDTTANVENLLATGADIVLSDFVSDTNRFLTAAEGKNVLVRRNISPSLIEFGPENELQEQIKWVRELAMTSPKVIIGTGVLSYNTSTERVLMVKNMCLETFSEK